MIRTVRNAILIGFALLSPCPGYAGAQKQKVIVDQDARGPASTDTLSRSF